MPIQHPTAVFAAGHLARKAHDFLEFIKFSHTIFAMPFALGSMFVAAGGLPNIKTAAGIVLAMIFARTAAMTFNRLVDWEIDKRNPRTGMRHRLASRPLAVSVCLASSLLFVVAAGWLNSLCLILSPVALAIIFFYSLTKRFTAFSHGFLGLALSVAPVGAWLAVTGEFAWPSFVLALAVLFWVAGFDVIYATQDYESDKREGLHSAVVRLGPARAIRLASGLHGIAFAGMALFGFSAGLGVWYFATLPMIGAALLWEHFAAKDRNPATINVAFFQANAVVGGLFMLGTALDVLIHAGR